MVLKPVVWIVDKKEVKNFYLAKGKPVGYWRAWLRSCTQEYQEEIQLAFREGIEVGACGLQFEHCNYPPYEATRHFMPIFFFQRRFYGHGRCRIVSSRFTVTFNLSYYLLGFNFLT